MHYPARLAIAAVACAIGLGVAVLGVAARADTDLPRKRPPVPRASPAPWSRPGQTKARAKAAGLRLDTYEHLKHHVHAHLDVFVDGKPVTVPAAIGMTDEVPHKKYRGELVYGFYKGKPCKHACVSPLHTHAAHGILHTESDSGKPNTLGEFFIEWGVRLAPDCVGGYCKPATPIHVFVDGAEETGDPNQIKLTNRREIAVVVGTPPDTVPSKPDFSFGV
jgi:hypothetical protein